MTSDPPVGGPGVDRAAASQGRAASTAGNPDVDALVERLGDVDGLPTERHLEVYEDVHRGLRDALTSLDDDYRS